MILAQYTIRTKQEYIFRTNRINEIVGASALISEIWGDLFRIATEIGLDVSRATESSGFDFDMHKNMNSKFISELFCGGGNLTVLYDSRTTYLELNKRFSYFVLSERAGMVPMAVCTNVTGDYCKDYKSLLVEAEKEKNRMNPARDCFILPFSKMDRNTFLPIAGEQYDFSVQREISYESAIKAKRGIELRDDSVKMIDDMVSKRGQESLLAVVHADGNNMGRKISRLLEADTDYSRCVKKMRRFTFDTAKAFTETGENAMAECKRELMKNNTKLKDNSFAYRVIVADGDDFTFICNARFAMEYTKAYLKAVCSYNGSEWKYSSCAGICIFHSHYPFDRAYSLAEQACDDGAKKMVHGRDDGSVEEGWVDFHYIHSGIGGNLSVIRKMQKTDEHMARPWLVTGETGSFRNYDNLDTIYGILKDYKITRTLLKEIGQAWESSKAAGRYSLERIISGKDELKNKLLSIMGNTDNLLSAIYDLSEVIDLWYEEVPV